MEVKRCSDSEWEDGTGTPNEMKPRVKSGSKHRKRTIKKDRSSRRKRRKLSSAMAKSELIVRPLRWKTISTETNSTHSFSANCHKPCMDTENSRSELDLKEALSSQDTTCLECTKGFLGGTNLRRLICAVKETTNKQHQNGYLNILKKNLDAYPPHPKTELQNEYLSLFTLNPASYLLEVLESAFIFPENNQYAGLMVLHFLVELLQVDYSCWCQSGFTGQTLLRRVIVGESPGKVDTSSEPCKSLLMFFCRLVTLNPKGVEDACDYAHLLSLLVSVIAVEEEDKEKLLKGDNPPSYHMADYLSRVLVGSETFWTQNYSHSSYAAEWLGNLEPAWFRLMVCHLCLQQFTFTRKPALCQTPFVADLKYVVDYYFYMIPIRSEDPASNETSNVIQPGLSCKTPSGTSVKPDKINNRNGKGETSLHWACMNRKHDLVNQLVSTQNVDVNIRDYAGWTPLHEAVSSNDPLTLLALLSSTIPSVQLDMIWNPHGADGITPLHDAVINNNSCIAQMILSRGGRKLLFEKDDKGRIPLSLSRSKEMKRILRNFVCCQETSEADEYTSKDIPMEEIPKYRRLLLDEKAYYDKDGRRIQVSQDDLYRYASVLQHLLSAYRMVTESRCHRKRNRRVHITELPLTQRDSDERVISALEVHLWGLDQHISRLANSQEAGNERVKAILTTMRPLLKRIGSQTW